MFALPCEPKGHVAIDNSGMLQSADGDHVQQAGDEFVVHMDREALNDYPMGKYDVSVIITNLEQDALSSGRPPERSSVHSSTSSATDSSRVGPRLW